MLSYITRGGTTAQGKQNIYFTAHPEDYDRYCEHTADLLHHELNCAVYYEREKGYGKITDRELLEMRMFVVPVTRLFLTGENRARNAELPFAREHGIPVLYLVMEEGLDELFRERIGKVQYLCPISRDQTEIGFYRKLSAFLDHILVSDEEQDRICQVFELNIFLSYRKKDRAHILPLMKQIHSKAGLEAVGFWYDEYLIPDEKYERAIEDQMKGSDLVLLVGTDHLLEEGNYVLTTEFPFALQQHIPVLGLEVETTDREALLTAYRGLSGFWPHGDWKRFCGTLKGIPGHKPMDMSVQERYYLLGLAYTRGIHVEQDCARGVDFLKRSAMCGYEKAIRRLADMYAQGLYIQPDLTAASQWQGRLEEITKEGYETQPSLENLKKWMDSKILRGEYCLMDGQYEEGHREFRECMELCGRAGVLEHQDFLELTVLSSSKLGLLARMAGREEEAQQYFQLQLELSKKRGGDGKTRPERLERIVGLTSQFDALITGEAYSEAAQLLQEALPLAEETYEQFPDNETLRFLAAVWDRYGELMWKAEGNFQAAKYGYEKAIAFSKQAFEEENTVQNLQNHSYRFYCFGKLAYQATEYEDAKKYLEKARRSKELLIPNLAALPKEQQAECQYMAQIYIMLGRIYELEGDGRTAGYCYGKAMEYQQS